MISLIYARSLNQCIGHNGSVPWQLPDEFAHFENTTRGKPIIMGRRTYEDHKSLLPGRLNIVISKQRDYQPADGVVLVHSLAEGVALANSTSDDVYIIGGVKLFTSALPMSDRVYETIVEADITGDTFLPHFDFSDWNTELLLEHAADVRHNFAFKVYRHSRRVPFHTSADRR